LSQETTCSCEALDAVIAAIGYVDSPVSRYCQAINSIELSISVAKTAPRAQEIARSTEALNAVVASL
jgi:hypothetical protein